MQVGISPKVKIPAWLVGAVGLVVVAAGAAMKDETVSYIGLGLLASVGISFPAGYRAPTGEVKIDIGEASDDALSAAAKQQINKPAG